MINTPLRVHIAPIGYDTDRVTIPLEKMAADRVWLVKEQNEDKDKGRLYFRDIEEFLENKLPKCEIKIETCDLINRDLFDTLRVYREILEKEAGNLIFINVSTGSKIQSIAGMLISMIFQEKYKDIIPYYVVPESYDEKAEDGRPLVKGCKQIHPIPSYKIERPREELIKVLKIINEETVNDKQITKKELIEILDKFNLLELQSKSNRREQDEKSAKYRALDRKFIEPLLDWKFISIGGTSRYRTIMLTDEGRNILKFLG